MIVTLVLTAISFNFVTATHNIKWVSSQIMCFVRTAHHCKKVPAPDQGNSI
jgi:hypothetical protein